MNEEVIVMPRIDTNHAHGQHRDVVNHADVAGDASHGLSSFAARGEKVCLKSWFGPSFLEAYSVDSNLGYWTGHKPCRSLFESTKHLSLR